MRFLIDVTDLRWPRQNKYTRILSSLLTEIEPLDGLPVEISATDAKIMTVQRPKPQVEAIWWHTTPCPRPWRLRDWAPALKLRAYYSCARVIGKAVPRKLKDRLAWNLAQCFEIFTPPWRERLGHSLSIDTDIKRRALFEFWLAERGVSLESCLIASGEETPGQMLSLGPSDVLILAGASWRHDASALAKSKNACGFKLVCLIYDLLPIDYPSLVTVRQRELYKKFLCDIGGAADLIVTPNLVTASQLKSFLSEKCISPGPIASISVSGAGLSQEPGEPGPRLHALGLPEKKFMLCVSALRERKHILWLYALCARLHQDQPGFPLLVIAGSAACVNILRILSDDPAWGRAGVFIEDPADAELAWLYQNAQICLQPAFEGGLGMTVIEAINYGRHCIAADAPSLVDSGGGFAEHLPRDEALWTNAIRRILDIEAGLNPANTSHLPPASSPGILAQIRTLLETDGKLLNKKMEQPAVL